MTVTRPITDQWLPYSLFAKQLAGKKWIFCSIWLLCLFQYGILFSHKWHPLSFEASHSNAMIGNLPLPPCWWLRRKPLLALCLSIFLLQSNIDRCSTKIQGCYRFGPSQQEKMRRIMVSCSQLCGGSNYNSFLHPLALCNEKENSDERNGTTSREENNHYWNATKLCSFERGPSNCVF